MDVISKPSPAYESFLGGVLKVPRRAMKPCRCAMVMQVVEGGGVRGRNAEDGAKQ